MLPSMVQIREAALAIRGTVLRTPLVRFDATDDRLAAEGLEIYLKLENLQPIGAFKIRGAANVMARTPPAVLAEGVVTASAGNMAQGVAWQARKLGVPCTVVAPESAPPTKIEAIERLGAKVLRVSYEEWWRAFAERRHPGVRGAFIHAFDDPAVMAGNGTIALEILEDLPDCDAIVTPWGGGGLTCGVAVAARTLRPRCRVFAAEVEGAAPLAAALEAGEPVEIDHRPSFVDGIGSRTVFADMFARARDLVAGSAVASVDEVAEALLVMLHRNHVLAEGAGAAPVAAALAGRAGTGKIACVVSGGNMDLEELAELIAGRGRA